MLLTITGIARVKIYLKRDLSFGKITAISLDTGKIVWQIPAGTDNSKKGNLIIGSQNFGGVAGAEKGEGVSFFTGSYDKKIYAFSGKDGKFLWNYELPATGSATPFIYNDSSEGWIFVVAGG